MPPPPNAPVEFRQQFVAHVPHGLEALAPHRLDLVQQFAAALLAVADEHEKVVEARQSLVQLLQCLEESETENVNFQLKRKSHLPHASSDGKNRTVSWSDRSVWWRRKYRSSDVLLAQRLTSPLRPISKPWAK